MNIILILGVINFLLVLLQVASGLRYIKLSFAVHIITECLADIKVLYVQPVFRLPFTFFAVNVYWFMCFIGVKEEPPSHDI